jgi:glucokinase
VAGESRAVATTVVGVDLGGTNVRAAVVAADGRLLCPPIQQASEGAAGVAGTTERIVRTVQDALRAAGVSAPGALGLAVPGVVDAATGVVRFAPNLGEARGDVFEPWRDVPLGATLERELGWPVVMGNDANLAALGEYRFGRGGDAAAGLVLLTLGTGVGGGVVLTREQVQGDVAWRGGALLVGAQGGGGELGHTVVLAGGPRCGCGAAGCLEALANRDAIVARARAKLAHRGGGAAGDGGRLRALTRGDPTRITPRLVAEAAADGDEAALEVWDETGAYVGIAVAGFINVFNPEVVAVGGQIARAGEPLFRAIRRAARDQAIPALFEACRIVPAERIDDGGVMGAAALALELARGRAA